MDFALTNDQLALREALSLFAKDRLNAGLLEREAASVFSLEGWHACAKYGVLGLPVPERYGGRGLNIMDTVVAMEGLGYGCHDNGLIFALNAQIWSVQQPISQFGSEAQKQAYLPGLVAGTLIGAHAVTEINSGSDAMSMSTVAIPIGEHYILNGSKTYVTNAPVADIFLVFAKTDPEIGMEGISAFLIEKDTKGFVVDHQFDKMGLRTAAMGSISIRNCKVRKSCLLGSLGNGLAIFSSSMELERGCLLAATLGTMKRQLELCVKRAKDRKQFGQEIGKFQSISNKIVDIYMRLELARLLVYRTAWLMSRGKSAIADAAMAKLFTSEAFVQTGLDAVQIHGAYGYLTENQIERDLRDAVASTIYSGTSEVQRLILARMLGL